jgi:hypothetical protein
VPVISVFFGIVIRMFYREHGWATSAPPNSVLQPPAATCSGADEQRRIQAAAPECRSVRPMNPLIRKALPPDLGRLIAF